MNGYFYHQYYMGQFVWLAPFIFIELALKAVALWKAAKNNHFYWFIALIFINSLGLLPVIYLLFFQKKK